MKKERKKRTKNRKLRKKEERRNGETEEYEDKVKERDELEGINKGRKETIKNKKVNKNE